MLSFVSPTRTAVFFARIVMPFSRSRSIESMTRSLTSWFSRNDPDCQSIASTSVVFPWSTCATIATFRSSLRLIKAFLPRARSEIRDSNAYEEGRELHGASGRPRSHGSNGVRLEPLDARTRFRAHAQTLARQAGGEGGESTLIGL